MVQEVAPEVVTEFNHEVQQLAQACADETQLDQFWLGLEQLSIRFARQYNLRGVHISCFDVLQPRTYELSIDGWGRGISLKGEKASHEKVMVALQHQSKAGGDGSSTIYHLVLWAWQQACGKEITLPFSLELT